MKAVQIQTQGRADVLEYVELPTPRPGPGQVLVKVESAAVNFSDVLRRRNDPYPFPTPLPFVPGSEIAGTIEALGDGVGGPPVGTPVFATAERASGGYAQYELA